MNPLAWGRRVAPAFRDRVRAIASHFTGSTADQLMAVIAQESGCTFSASIKNAAGSGAIGLLQFMPQTAALLGTSTAKLAAMSPLDQLDYVDAYFRPLRNRLHNLGDLYCAVLWPAGIGQPDSAILFEKGGDHPKLYLENKGLDLNFDNDITRGEVIQRVQSLLVEGLKPANAA